MENIIRNARAEYASLPVDKEGKIDLNKVDEICEKYNLTDGEMWAMLFNLPI